jgi:phosphatidylserine synthase
MIIGKKIADLITIIRGILGFCLAWLGLTQGLAGLSLAVWLLIAAWTSDSLDGPIARRSRAQYQTWVGEHDLEIDMAVSAGLLVYLLGSKVVNVWIVLLYIILWGLVFWRLGMIPRSFGMLFQAPIYGLFIWVAIQELPGAGRWLIIWILAAVILTWPQFPKQVLPGFLSGMRKVWVGRRNHDE